MCKQKHSFSFRCLVFVSLLITAPFLYADELDLNDNKHALGQLGKLLGGAQDMRGEFVQFMVDGRGTRVQETRGEFKAKKPDHFYWATKAPLEQEIYVSGGLVTVYDPDLEQATIQNLGEDLANTPALLFNGDAESIARNFIVEQRKTPTEPNSDSSQEQQFLLFPIEDGSLFEVLRVRFSAGKISDLRISDSLGQDTTVSFIHTEINSGLSAADFEASLPEGTDIIRQN